MSKYVYIGGSASDHATFRVGQEAVTLKGGVPTEVPQALEFRVKGNPHFALVEEAVDVEVKVETSTDGGEPFEPRRVGSRSKK